MTFAVFDVSFEEPTKMKKFFWKNFQKWIFYYYYLFDIVIFADVTFSETSLAHAHFIIIIFTAFVEATKDEKVEFQKIEKGIRGQFYERSKKYFH